MNDMEIAARLPTAGTGRGLREALDINDNGPIGRPDALAWLCFATGLFRVAVVIGTFFVGVVAPVHGMARIGRSACGGVQRRQREVRR